MVGCPNQGFTEALSAVDCVLKEELFDFPDVEICIEHHCGQNHNAGHGYDLIGQAVEHYNYPWLIN